MVAGARLEGMRAVRAGDAAGRTQDHRRALVMGLVGEDARRRGSGRFIPGALERGLIALRAVALQELAVDADAVLNEVLRRLQEHRAPLVGVGLQQGIAAPALEPGGEL